MDPLNATTTVYLKNLNDKLRKEDLKQHLYSLYSAYGQILDIVALKTSSMRGQAFIVFKEASSVPLAIEATNGLSFFGKPIKAEPAKAKSKSRKVWEEEVWEPERLRQVHSIIGIPNVQGAQQNKPEEEEEEEMDLS